MPTPSSCSISGARRTPALGLLAVALLFESGSAVAQPAEPMDPIRGTRTITDSAELFLLWGAPQDGTTHQRVVDFLALHEDTLVLRPDLPGPQTEADAWGLYRSGEMHTAVAKLDDEGFFEAVCVWEGPDSSVVVVVPEIDPVSLAWSDAHRFSLSGVLPPFGNKIIRVVAGDFDGDRLDELAVAFINWRKQVEIVVLEGDGTPAVVPAGGIQDDLTFMVQAHGFHTKFDIASGDFDGDADDEIAIVAYTPDWNGEEPGSGYGVYVKVYDLDRPGGGDYVLTATDSEVVFVEPAFSHSSVYQAIVTGDFDRDYADEIAVVFVVRPATQRGPATGLIDTRLALVDVGKDLTGLTVTDVEESSFLHNNELPALALASGDLTRDGGDELVLALNTRTRLYDADDLMLTHRASASSGSEEGEDYIYDETLVGIANLNSVDSEFGDELEIVRVDNMYRALRVGNEPTGQPFQRIEVVAFRLTDTDQPAWRLDRALVGESDPLFEDRGRRHLAFALADFDGDRIRIGPPEHRNVTNAWTPLVVVNAPPIHFDVLSGVSYDVNQCFGAGDCMFTATYEQTVVQQIGLTLDLHSTWSLGASLGADADVFGIKVGAKLDGTYGEELRFIDTERQTISISTTVVATEDDMVYATVSDYDLFEYPVYAEGKFQGHFVIVMPVWQGNVWFPSKSPETGRSYRPDHEPGNILSYRTYPTLAENENVAELVRGSNSDSFILNDTQHFEWFTKFEHFVENQAQTSWKSSLAGEVSVGIASGNGSYTEEEISTHTTSVSDEMSLKVSLDGVDLGIGNTQYRVTPYTYWSKQGALVVDYAVRPEVAAPGEEDTWWNTHYGQKPDPGFILRWRYDPEKGRPVSDTQRKRTNQIQFFPPKLTPGESVHVEARVHNLSLVDTPGPVSVAFYLGDPSLGGTPMIGSKGETEVSTLGPIPARGFETVSIDWLSPETDDEFLTVWAVIDEAGSIDEIHENNNRGWTVLTLLDDLTPVLLETFEGFAGRGRIELLWITGAGSTHTGFHVWRAHERVMEYRRLTVEPLVSEHFVDDDVSPEEVYLYRLEIVDRDGSSVFFGPLRLVGAPSTPALVLSQNVPNPFGATTTMTFDTPSEDVVVLGVFDVRGRLVRRLLDAKLEPGRHTVVWDGTDHRGVVIQPGVYFYRLESGGAVSTRKLLRAP